MSGVIVRRAERLGHTHPSTARVVTEIAVTSAVVGVVMGVLWWVLAPDVAGVVVDGQLAADAREAQKLFDRDAIFALLAAGCGLVLAVAFMVRHRHSPVAAVVTLAVTGIGASFIASLTGGLLGPDGDVAGLDNGTAHAFPLRMDSSAGLLVWSMVTTVIVAVLAVFREDRTPWSVPGAPPER